MQALRFAKRFARQVNHVAFPFCLQGRRSELVLRRSIPGPPIPCLRFARRHRHQPRDCSERRRVRRLHLMGRERREARWPTAIQAERYAERQRLRITCQTVALRGDRLI